MKRIMLTRQVLHVLPFSFADAGEASVGNDDGEGEDQGNPPRPGARRGASGKETSLNIPPNDLHYLDGPETSPWSTPWLTIDTYNGQPRNNPRTPALERPIA